MSSWSTVPPIVEKICLEYQSLTFSIISSGTSFCVFLSTKKSKLHISLVVIFASGKVQLRSSANQEYLFVSEWSLIQTRMPSKPLSFQGWESFAVDPLVTVPMVKIDAFKTWNACILFETSKLEMLIKLEN